MKKTHELNTTSAELKTNITEHVNSLAELKIFDLEGKHFENIKAQNSTFETRRKNKYHKRFR